MLKQIYFLRRRQDLTREEFQDHWLEAHAKYGRRVRPVRRYVQYHTVETDAFTPPRSESEVDPYDGVAILWWDSLEAFKETLATNETVVEAFEDERLFIDHDRSRACLTDEVVVIEPIGSGNVVLLEALTRKEGLSREEFQQRWADHQEMGERVHEGGTGFLKGYIQNHTRPDSEDVLEELGGDVFGGEETFDGVATAYFDSVVQAKRLFQSQTVAEDSFEDEQTFLEHRQGSYMLARRHPIKDRIR